MLDLLLVTGEDLTSGVFVYARFCVYACYTVSSSLLLSSGFKMLGVLVGLDQTDSCAARWRPRSSVDNVSGMFTTDFAGVYASYAVVKVAALVVDIGSGVSSAGFAGDDATRFDVLSGGKRALVCRYGFVGTDCVVWCFSWRSVGSTRGSLTPAVSRHGARPSSLHVRIFF